MSMRSRGHDCLPTLGHDLTERHPAALMRSDSRFPPAPQSRPAACVKSFGRREAYERRRRPNRRAGSKVCPMNSCSGNRTFSFRPAEVIGAKSTKHQLRSGPSGSHSGLWGAQKIRTIPTDAAAERIHAMFAIAECRTCPTLKRRCKTWVFTAAGLRTLLPVSLLVQGSFIPHWAQPETQFSAFQFPVLRDVHS